MQNIQYFLEKDVNTLASNDFYFFLHLQRSHIDWNSILCNFVIFFYFS
jgi:hypothetical protein